MAVSLLPFGAPLICGGNPVQLGDCHTMSSEILLKQTLILHSVCSQMFLHAYNITRTEIKKKKPFQVRRQDSGAECVCNGEFSVKIPRGAQLPTVMTQIRIENGFSIPQAIRHFKRKENLLVW